ncbi:tetratricopeptide repeat protein [Cytophaga aurantiaca]|uniref:tetratricopeptide repeat protein n=1 Tax=Cytophaga aurantiaca TaxID=29530 RepID=UPI00036CB3D7|nr:tetratricopeptide repeat protein [Cytophaga aurantiaca]
MAELTEKSATQKAQTVVTTKVNMSAEELIEKYKKPALVGLAVVVALVGAFTFYKYNQSENNTAAQSEMYQAVFFFEQDSLELALKGIPAKEIKGLQEVADEYSDTKAGKLAAFYTGVIYLKQGKFQEAIDYLDKFDTNEGIMQARAWSLIGDAYTELNDNDNAISYYKKASEYKENEQLTPSYLMKLALAYELKSDWKEAAATYDKVITEYPKSQDVSDAKKYKAKATASLSASE